MLQSEFFERTGVTLTIEEYGAVESVYNSVKMDKDQFCKEWKKLRKNQLFVEMAESMNNRITELTKSHNRILVLEETIKQTEKKHKESIRAEVDDVLRDLEDFARKIIRTGCDDAKVYDVIEEEFSIGFIIKTKREAGIPLSDAEIDYMVGKL